MPLLRNDLRPVLLDHIHSNAKQKGIHIDSMNCHLDHVHCLISLGIEQNISNVVGLLKGESSHWINLKRLVPVKFSWQNEYFAVSVSMSHIRRIQDYIRNQEAHHKKKTFQEEYDEFIRQYGFKNLG
jgi:REP element-mobilizing transposase RayT